MTVTFLILAAITIAGTAAAMALRNLVHCVLALTLGFAGLSALYLQLGAQFVGLTQILVYVGAVAILAVFAIMMTQHPTQTSESIFSSSWFSGGLIAALVFAVLGWAIHSSNLPSGVAMPQRAGCRPAHRRRPDAPLCSATGDHGPAVDRRADRRRDPRHARKAEVCMSSLTSYLLLSALLFSIGLAGALTRRNAILVLIGIELMLNAANLNFIAFWRYGPHPEALTGVMFAIFSIGIAAAEAAVGLGIILAVYRHSKTTDLDQMNSMKG